MKKALIIIGAILAIVLVLGWLNRETLQFLAMSMAMQPDTAFVDTTPPSPPDYANPDHWAALPDRNDLADMTPGDSIDAQHSAAVDVFFIHPTTYYSSASWNQPLDNAEANATTDYGVLRNQASVFNSCCKVYAPRYRQATLYSFFDQAGGGADALSLAYGDVEAAFDYFLEHHSADRPFILAAHSQGSLHLDTLLAERIRGTALAKRMIAAYPIGYYLDGSNGIPVCSHATETGCQVTWNALAPGVNTFSDVANPICVNPLNWASDGSRADFADNLGAVTYGMGDSEPANPGAPEPGIADARCTETGALEVTEIRSADYPSLLFGEGNYHVYDYSLFHMNIRQNALDRVAAWMVSGS